jgi:hypothetical protein
MKDAAITVNRCLWSPDGTILGMKVVHFSANSHLGMPMLKERHLAIFTYLRVCYFRWIFFNGAIESSCLM